MVVLDGNHADDPAQTAFLRRTLRAASEPVRIVAFHQPIYTAGLHPAAEAARRRWEPIFRAGRVSLVLQGHNHAYERLQAKGITYITTGGRRPDLPLRAPLARLRRCVAAHHFLTVTVTARAIAVRAVTPAGSTLERARIAVR